MNNDEKPAFSYFVKVGHISANPVEVHIEANEAERRRLRDLWNVVGRACRSASDLQIGRWKKDGVKVKGRVHGEDRPGLRRDARAGAKR